MKDRERKLLSRKTKAGKRKRRLEYQALARKRLPLPPTAKYDPATCGPKLQEVNAQNCGRRFWPSRPAPCMFFTFSGSRRA